MDKSGQSYKSVSHVEFNVAFSDFPWHEKRIPEFFLNCRRKWHKRLSSWINTRQCFIGQLKWPRVQAVTWNRCDSGDFSLVLGHHILSKGLEEVKETHITLKWSELWDVWILHQNNSESNFSLVIFPSFAPCPGWGQLLYVTGYVSDGDLGGEGRS